MNDPQGPELVPSLLKILFLIGALCLMAAGTMMMLEGRQIVGGLVGYGGVLIVFGCYAHGNGERNRLRALQREHRYR